MKTKNIKLVITIFFLIFMATGFSVMDKIPISNNNKNEEVNQNTNSVFSSDSKNSFSTIQNSMVDTCSYSWAAQTSGTANVLLTVHAVSDQIGWVAGAGPTVVKTSNGGINWTSATGTGLAGTIYNIYAWSANEALCAANSTSTSIYKTSNGGVTWSQVYNQVGGFINAVQMISSTEGYGLGDPVGGKWTVVKTTDGGNTWARMATEPTQIGAEAGWNNSFQIEGTNMWFGTSDTRVYHSSNLGLTWTSAATTGTLNTYALHFSSLTNGLAGGNAMVKSTDGGSSFTSTGSPGTTGNLNGLEGNGNDWWSLRADANIYRSINHGANWTTAYNLSGAVFQDIDFTVVGGCPKGWAVGNAGKIAKMSATSGSNQFVNDINSTAILEPLDTIFSPIYVIAPKARFKNIGSANQTNIPVTFIVTGPVNYTSTRTITSLNSGDSTLVTFDSSFIPVEGFYNIKIYSSLATDQNRNNDTLNNTVVCSRNLNLGYASSFAILSGGNISAIEETIILNGHLGAFGQINPEVISNDSSFSNNHPSVQNALEDLSNLKNNLNTDTGISINGNLGGTTLGEGIFEIQGDAVINGVLTFSGDSNSVFILNIHGNLTFMKNSVANLNQTLPKNIVWNVDNNVNTDTGTILNGILLSNGNIFLSKFTSGMYSLLTTGNVQTVNTGMISSYNLLRSLKFSNLIQNYDNCVDSKAQSEGYTRNNEIVTQDCNKSSSDFFNNYGKRDNWRLGQSLNINPPIITILVNFHSFQNNAGGNNFQQNIKNDSNYIKNMLLWASEPYLYNRLPSDPITGVIYPQDSKIRFKLNRIEFYQSDLLNTSNDYSQFLNAIVNRDPLMLNQLNVFLSEAETGYAGSAWAPSFDLNQNSCVNMYGNYDAFLKGGGFCLAQSLGHEFGHILGCGHTHYGGGWSSNCGDPSSDDYYDDIFGPFPGNCPHDLNWPADAWVSPNDGITNNFMGGNESWGNISPKQIGNMHRALALMNVRKYVECIPNNFPPSPLTITNNEYWDFDIKLYRNLVIKSPATLTVACKVVMPPEGKIIVERGAKLILDGGILTTDCPTNMWSGIEVWGDRSKNQTGLNFNAHGIVTLKNQAVIENAVDGITTIKSLENGDYDWSYTGGIIKASGQSKFKNCWRGVQFLSYPYYNNSRFTDCIFETTSELNDPALLYPYCFISMYEMNGVSIAGSNFINSTTLPFINRGQGIIALNSTISLSGICNVPSTFPCPNNYIQYNSFEGLNFAVNATNSSTAYSGQISHTKFLNNYQGVYIKGIPYLNISNNIFDVGQIAGITDSYGLFLEDCAGYLVEGNEFYSTHSGKVGSICKNSGIEKCKFYRNRYNNLEDGTRALGINEGLSITCNSYENISHSDISVFDGSISALQGSIDFNAGNTFSREIGYDLYFSNYIPSASPFIYFCNGTRNDCLDYTKIYQVPLAITIYNVTASSQNLCLPTTYYIHANLVQFSEENLKKLELINKQIENLKDKLIALPGTLENEISISNINTTGDKLFIKSQIENEKQKSSLLINEVFNKLILGYHNSIFTNNSDSNKCEPFCSSLDLFNGDLEIINLIMKDKENHGDIIRIEDFENIFKLPTINKIKDYELYFKDLTFNSSNSENHESDILSEGRIAKNTSELPMKYSISQNYPNPFNPATKINYDLPVTGQVTIKIYDIAGKEVVTLVNEIQNAGRYSATFSGVNLASGMYFYKITAGTFTAVKKMMLIK